MNYSNLVAIKSVVGSPVTIPDHINREDYVIDKNGGVELLSKVPFFKKAFIGKKELVTVLKSKHNLRFQ